MTSSKDQTVLITGAANRLGAATARALHQAGMRVAIHYRHSKTAAAALRDELNATRADSCLIVQADLTDVAVHPRVVDTVIETWGRLDALVNNASTFYPTPIGRITEANWDDLMGSNLKAPLFLSQAAAPALTASQGCIVNLIDIHAQKPLAGHPVYCAAKAGLGMLTMSLARELGPDVRVNGVAPGAILWPEGELDDDAKREILSRTALKRSGTPEDIANTVLFLVRDGGYITGQIIAVDGGRSVHG